jgi:hypothetical protein
MQKNLHQIHYHRLFSLYRKLKNRFEKSLKENRFKNYTERKQREIISRLEKLKTRLTSLEQVLKLSGSALALGLMLGSGEVQAQAPVASGSEFLVNTYTTDGQVNPSIAMDKDGDFVVVWADFSGDVYGQRYNASGIALGSEFRVNTYTTGGQSNPSIAMDKDGDFVVAWTSLYQDGDRDGIYCQRYNAQGVAQGSEFQVNTYTTSMQFMPSIAMNSQGDFAVTWISYGQDGSAHGVYGQRYNALGIAQGSEFQVNTYTTSTQDYPSIAMDSIGNFVVAWQSRGQEGSFNSYGTYGQRYNASGAAQGSEFQINTYNGIAQLFPKIAMESDGDFAVTWTSYIQDGSSGGIYAQRYNAAGVAQGSEFQVNTYTPNRQIKSSIAMDSNGDFVVAWQSYGQDGDNYGIYAQRYNASGVAQGSEFPVNSYTTSGQHDPSIAMDQHGNFVVAWTSNYQDGDGYGIYAQRYIIPPNQAPTDISLSASSVDENVADNTTIGTLSTSDPDAGNTFTYSLVTGTGDSENAFFNISGNSLNITYSPDFENKSSYSIRVRTTDQGSLSFDKVFTITINDINEAPVIAAQTFSVDENSANGTLIGNIIASDQDAGQTLSFAITSGNTDGKFSINSGTGDITVAGALDFETASSYSLTVKATDDASSPLSSSAILTFNINDVNEAPVIAAQTFSVDENSANGTSVGIVAASDVDAGQTLSYAITSGNTAGKFSINSGTGEITVAGALDFETTSSYSLTVSATDNGTSPLSSSATITVNINDVVENPSGIANAGANKQISIFPNPSEGQFIINSGTLTLENYMMRVVNMMGETVYTGSFSEHLDLQQLSKGVYTLMLESEKQVMVKQIVIK